MKKFLFTGLMAGLLGHGAHAQVQFTDLLPDVNIRTWDAKELDLDKDARTDIALWFHPWGEGASTQAATYNVFAVSFYEVELLGDNINGEFYPFVLEKNVAINNTGGTWQSIDHNSVYLIKEGNSGFWKDQPEGYLAVRIKKADDWYYSWVKLGIENKKLPFSLTISEFASNSSANAELLAGEGSTTAGVYNHKIADNKPKMFLSAESAQLVLQNVEVASKLIIYDMQGRARVIINDLKERNMNLDLNELESGLYLAVLETFEAQQTFKFEKH